MHSRFVNMICCYLSPTWCHGLMCARCTEPLELPAVRLDTFFQLKFSKSDLQLAVSFSLFVQVTCFSEEFCMTECGLSLLCCREKWHVLYNEGPNDINSQFWRAGDLVTMTAFVPADHVVASKTVLNQWEAQVK